MTDYREAALKAWATRLAEMEEEDYQALVLKRLDREEKASSAYFRSVIVNDCGGVKDEDYESIPVWARRRNGTTLDDLIEVATRHGYYCETANDVYQVLQEVSP